MDLVNSIYQGCQWVGVSMVCQCKLSTFAGRDSNSAPLAKTYNLVFISFSTHAILWHARANWTTEGGCKGNTDEKLCKVAFYIGEGGHRTPRWLDKSHALERWKSYEKKKEYVVNAEHIVMHHFTNYDRTKDDRIWWKEECTFSTEFAFSVPSDLCSLGLAKKFPCE